MKKKKTTNNEKFYKESFNSIDPKIQKEVDEWVDKFNNVNKPKYIIIREDGSEFYHDKDGNMIILDDFEYACNMIGMLEVDGYVCEIKYHHKEDEL